MGNAGPHGAVIDLAGKTAIVTGASRGIGRAIAVGYAAAGADVALIARSPDALAEVGEEVQRAGRRAVVLPCDVTDRDAVRRMVDAAVRGLGHIDVLVNNAGGTAFRAPFTEVRHAGWDKVMRLNLDSIVQVTQAVGPHLLERGSGAVVVVSSVAGQVATPELTPYGAAKAAAISLTKSLAAEWARAGVRVNALCPGWVATELSRALWDDEELSRQTLGPVPMGRWARPEEMVGPAIFLASDAASFVTGQALFVDGGMTVW